MDIANFVRATLKRQEVRYNISAVLFILALYFGSSESASFGVFVFTKLVALLLLTLVYLVSRDSQDQKDTVSLEGANIWSPAAVQLGYQKLNRGQSSGSIACYDQDSSETKKEILVLGYSEVVETKHTTPRRAQRRHIPAKLGRKRPKLPKNELADKQLSLW